MERILECMKSKSTQSIAKGQWISILIAGTGIFATFLSDTSANFPTLMNIFNYVLLVFYLFRRRKKWDSQVNKRIWWYIGAALLDVEANYLVIVAYNYTTITSIMLLDCFTIPCAMALSYFFLSCQYTYRHVLGTCLCLVGLVCIVLSDTLSNGKQMTANNALYGDIMCLAGSALYACSNVLQENMVKFHNREEYLGFLGLFGAPIALIQCLSIDLENLRHTTFTTEIYLYIAGFVLCLFLMYVSTSALLQTSDAVFFNLSLLTSDVYAVIFSYFLTGNLVNWLYFPSFALVAVGLWVYHSEVSPMTLSPLLTHNSSNINSVDLSSQADEEEQLRNGKYAPVHNILPITD